MMLLLFCQLSFFLLEHRSKITQKNSFLLQILFQGDESQSSLINLIFLTNTYRIHPHMTRPRHDITWTFKGINCTEVLLHLLLGSGLFQMFFSLVSSRGISVCVCVNDQHWTYLGIIIMIIRGRVGVGTTLYCFFEFICFASRLHLLFSLLVNWINFWNKKNLFRLLHP